MIRLAPDRLAYPTRASARLLAPDRGGGAMGTGRPHRIQIVEDDYFIGMQIEDALAAGIVSGPGDEGAYGLHRLLAGGALGGFKIKIGAADQGSLAAEGVHCRGELPGAELRRSARRPPPRSARWGRRGSMPPVSACHGASIVWRMPSSARICIFSATRVSPGTTRSARLATSASPASFNSDCMSFS